MSGVRGAANALGCAAAWMLAVVACDQREVPDTLDREEARALLEALPRYSEPASCSGLPARTYTPTSWIHRCLVQAEHRGLVHLGRCTQRSADAGLDDGCSSREISLSGPATIDPRRLDFGTFPCGQLRVEEVMHVRTDRKLGVATVQFRESVRYDVETLAALSECVATLTWPAASWRPLTYEAIQGDDGHWFLE